MTTDIEFRKIMKYDHCYTKPPSIQENYNNAGFQTQSEIIAIDEDVSTISAEDDEYDSTSESIDANKQTPSVQLHASSHTCDILKTATLCNMHMESDESTLHADVTATDDEESSKTDQEWLVEQRITALSQLLLLFRVCRQPGCGEDTILSLKMLVKYIFFQVNT